MSELSHSDDSPAPPASSKPRREGNDSLWKRARRTLGTNSLTFLQPQSRPTGASAPATGSGPAGTSKRREQVRHAQRTHRQRTQNYIKTLESEVVRLRESEMKLMTEKEKFQGQLDILKSTLVLSDIPFPPGVAETPPPSRDTDMPAEVSYSADGQDHQRLHVHWPNPSSQNSGADFTQGFRESSAYQQPNLAQDLPNGFSLEPMDFSSPTYNSSNISSAYDPAPLRSNQPYATPTPSKTFASVDTIETAINFVLALEHPCMQHIPYPADPSGADPANHMMMASTPLVARSPGLPKVNSTWTASGTVIKELLNLSSSINLEGEITPVEAWHRLHQHPDFWRLDKVTIEKMKIELSAAVRCCGFGAVLDESIFLHSLNSLLATTL